jgi:hypothetical protein
LVDVHVVIDPTPSSSIENDEANITNPNTNANASTTTQGKDKDPKKKDKDTNLLSPKDELDVLLLEAAAGYAGNDALASTAAELRRSLVKKH